MSNILTHNTNLGTVSVQSYASEGNKIVLDLNYAAGPDGGPVVLEMTQLQALGLSKIVEAAIRDAQSGTFLPPSPAPAEEDGA